MSREPIFAAFRTAYPDMFNLPGTIGLVDGLCELVESLRVANDGEPAWLVEARRHLGLKEIVGRKHNATILGWVKSLGGWFTDDETPWCGTFVAACMLKAGIDAPEHWYRARAWNEWGKPCGSIVGAVAVFARTGGGHVGFVVGESATSLYILGGNQSNAVTITPIKKDRLLGLRWPSSIPLAAAGLPRMAGGTVSRNEA